MTILYGSLLSTGVPATFVNQSSYFQFTSADLAERAVGTLDGYKYDFKDLKVVREGGPAHIGKAQSVQALSFFVTAQCSCHCHCLLAAAPFVGEDGFVPTGVWDENTTQWFLYQLSVGNHRRSFQQGWSEDDWKTVANKVGMSTAECRKKKEGLYGKYTRMLKAGSLKSWDQHEAVAAIRNRVVLPKPTLKRPALADITGNSSRSVPQGVFLLTCCIDINPLGLWFSMASVCSFIKCFLFGR